MNENEYSIGYEVLYSDCAHEYNMHLKYKKEYPLHRLNGIRDIPSNIINDRVHDD